MNISLLAAVNVYSPKNSRDFPWRVCVLLNVDGRILWQYHDGPLKHPQKVKSATYRKGVVDFYRTHPEYLGVVCCRECGFKLRSPNGQIREKLRKLQWNRKARSASDAALDGAISRLAEVVLAS